ncbi:MAG TPA: hypothetical protein VKG01_17090 [Thermoanaerobaculia bacterium]|nr:hypothetical protein [Thermoanaerobaculia bacterium]
MRKKFVIAAIVVLVLAALVAGTRYLMGEEKPVEVTLQGTVVDLHCYLEGVRVAEHTACANSCIKRGLPAGFLADDGTLYVLLEEKPVSVKDRVAGLADVPVKVTGKTVTRNGVKGLQITSIEKLKTSG